MFSCFTLTVLYIYFYRLVKRLQIGFVFTMFFVIKLQEIVAISCSWCKTAFHNKENCFNMQRIGENCHLGIHTDLVVPPSWIVKLPRRVSPLHQMPFLFPLTVPNLNFP
jgi:hypothetical protein